MDLYLSLPHKQDILSIVQSTSAIKKKRLFPRTVETSKHAFRKECSSNVQPFLSPAAHAHCPDSSELTSSTHLSGGVVSYRNDCAHDLSLFSGCKNLNAPSTPIRSVSVRSPRPIRAPFSELSCNALAGVNVTRNGEIVLPTVIEKFEAHSLKSPHRRIPQTITDTMNSSSKAQFDVLTHERNRVSFRAHSLPSDQINLSSVSVPVLFPSSNSSSCESTAGRICSVHLNNEDEFGTSQIELPYVSRISESSSRHLLDGLVSSNSLCSPCDKPFVSEKLSPLSKISISEPDPIQKCTPGSSDDDDEFETFLSKLRQRHSPQITRNSSSSFFTDSSDSGSEVASSPLFYYQIDNSTKRARPTQRSITTEGRPLYLREQSANSERNPSSNNQTTFSSCLPRNVGQFKRSVSSPSSCYNFRSNIVCSSKPAVLLDFVYSLYPFYPSTEQIAHQRHPSAERFVKHFKANRHELARKLFQIYNERVFGNTLPADLDIIWNSRLVKTAGQCKYLRREMISVDGERTVTRLAQIELSPKVCTTAERVRDTLLHETCHAAVWIVNGVNDGHGSLWRSWAARALRIWPKLPLVSVCHAYTIETRYTYRCTGCGTSVNRHSKSIDITKQVCGRCNSRFELLVNTRRGRKVHQSEDSVDRSHAQFLRTSDMRRPPSLTLHTPSERQRPPFAEFVRTNYKNVRQRSDVKTHAEAMTTLGALFKSMRLTASSCDLVPGGDVES